MRSAAELIVGSHRMHFRRAAATSMDRADIFEIEPAEVDKLISMLQTAKAQMAESKRAVANQLLLEAAQLDGN